MGDRYPDLKFKLVVPNAVYVYEGLYSLQTFQDGCPFKSGLVVEFQLKMPMSCCGIREISNITVGYLGNGHTIEARDYYEVFKGLLGRLSQAPVIWTIVQSINASGESWKWAYPIYEGLYMLGSTLLKMRNVHYDGHLLFTQMYDPHNRGNQLYNSDNKLIPVMSDYKASQWTV